MINASAKPDSIAAMSFESEHKELQQELLGYKTGKTHKYGGIDNSG
jgi:hypothetical protein